MGDDNSYKFDEELKNLLEKLNSPNRKVAFLFGSGTSVCANLPTMEKLTDDVEAKLDGENLVTFKLIRSKFKAKENIEQILSFLEEAKGLKPFEELFSEKTTTLDNLESLNLIIREKISEVINENVNLKSTCHHDFASWLCTRKKDTEIYTLNYDLALETAFENKQLLYFDGFVGGISPIFQPATVDPALYDVSKEIRPPDSWVRLWKMHGSVNWIYSKENSKSYVRRLSSINKNCLIYPSISKYTESRRSPFLVLQDKLRRHLSAKNVTLVILGYGFGDQHINEIIFDSIERNALLDVVVLSYDEIKSDDEVKKKFDVLKKFSIFSPNGFYFRGDFKKWKDKPDLNLGDAKLFFERVFKSYKLEHSEVGEKDV